MNTAFIALCFGQSLPDLPPLGRRVSLSAFYRLVKATLKNERFQSLNQFLRLAFKLSFFGRLLNSVAQNVVAVK